MNHKRTEIVLTLSLLFHLQWFFGNLYEEILTPNSIVASVEQINAYNRFFAITEPYYYYIPLTQIGFCLIVLLALTKTSVPSRLKTLLHRAAFTSGSAIALTGYIVTQYNLKLFFGNVDRFGERLHLLYLEWAILNGVRLLLLGITIFFLYKVYRGFLIKQSHDCE
ncbi:MAG: hypothetical protein KME45_16355 [Stenomitos rutilans HA7619-LM2]|jgi:hypothetical protein|nr:hypothetical protein [Stenomitos rutilans HA7619-LM2]